MTKELRPDRSLATERPPVGWYADPSWSHRLRLWDGVQWTDQTRAAPIGWAQAPSDTLIAERASWLRGCAVVAILAIVVAVIGVSEPARPTDVATTSAHGPTYIDVVRGGPTALVVDPTTTIAPPSTTSTTANPATAGPASGRPQAATDVVGGDSSASPATTRGPIGLPHPPTSPATNDSDYSLIGARWNGCQTITVSSAGPDVASVVAELASVTGLHLKGVSGRADIEVSWGAISMEKALGEADVAAAAGTILHVTVVISPRGAPVLATLLRHEMAHALGLGHARTPSELMYPVLVPESPTTYQAGDLAGLRRIGAPTSGC